MSDKVRRKKRREEGQSTVELALLLPVFLLLLFGIIEFGMLFGAQLTLQSCAEETARYVAINAEAISLNAEIEDHIGDPAFVGDIDAEASFSDITRKSGSVTVKLTSHQKALTFVGYIFFGEDGILDLTAEVTTMVR